MIRSPDINSWTRQLSEGTKFHLGIIQAMWDNCGEIVPRYGTTLETAISEQKVLLHVTLTSMTSDKKRILRLLGLWTGESAHGRR